MSKRLYTADVNIQADTLIYTYGCGREGEHAPSRATAEQPINIKEISGLADKVSKALSSCDVSNLKTLGGTLYDRLIPKKFAAVITPSQSASELPQQPSRDNFVFYLLNPKITWIPWELLYDGDAFLCRRFCISRSLVKTGDEFELSHKRLDVLRQSGVLVLLGETSGLNTNKEIEEILRILTPVIGNHIVVRDAANKRVTVEYLKENYDICHFIGHGVFSMKNRKESGWRLQDGTVLTCSDIERVKSPKAFFPSLIIANSCYSARSAPSPSNAQKYVTSLYRSFLSKGVPQYIGTIASIPDDVSQVFTSAFYSALASGNPVGEAVFQAREATSAGPGWGYYVHYGDPGFSIFTSTGSQSHPQGVAIPSERPALEVIIAQRRQPDIVHVRRFDKLRFLRNRIQLFAEGCSDAVLFRGEAGVGKSVFLTDILDEVRNAVPNALCGIASCRRSNLSREYVPLKELLRSLLAPGGTPITINDRVLAGILRFPHLFNLCRPDLLFAGDWPQVSRRFVSRTPVQGIGAIDHEHLLRELKAFIDGLSKGHPVVIALEDLQWADEASADLFFSLMSVGERRLSVLAVGSFRAHNISVSLGSRLNEAYQRGVARLSLDFDKMELESSIAKQAQAFVIRYLRKSLPISSQYERPSFRLVTSLLDYSAGNSFLLSEIVKTLRARDQVFRTPGMFYQHWMIQDDVNSQITTPVLGWLRERLGDLDAELETILLHASIEGQEFGLDLLSKLLGRNSADVLKSLQELEWNHQLIVRTVPSAALIEHFSRLSGRPHEASEQAKSPRFLFRHEVFVWFFRSLLTFEEKRRLHRIAGEYLEELSKQRYSTVRHAALIYHFTEAGDHMKAMDYLLSAAKGYWDIRLITVATHLYRKALRLCMGIHRGIHSSFKEQIEAALAQLTPFEWQDLGASHYGLSEKRRLVYLKQSRERWDKLWPKNVDSSKVGEI